MPTTRNLFRFALLILSLTVCGFSQAADKFKACWSHYTGWEPWGYATAQGILKKWADKYGIEVEMTLVNDYVESINLYTSGAFDACAMANMDALTIPAVGGVDSEVVIVGDYSNGNDGIVLKKGQSLKDIKGRKVLLVELSVSHYLLARALDKNGLTEKDITTVNTSDADIASVFVSTPANAVVTWNPPLQQVRNAKGAKLVFDSSQIPGEILDLMVVKTAADERLKKALTGAWYEVMALMASEGQGSREAIAAMAAQAGSTEAEFKAQLATTKLFPTPAEAAAIATAPQLKETMRHVRDFSFAKGLFGSGAASADFVGIEFPDKSVLGSTRNVKLRFTDRYMRMAAEGAL
jgi:NitT/TauT family transport system substrate-binding protein